jgi:hypothetical protein
MAFLPKNKYQKFYTNGNKFILLKTEKSYTGDYFVTDKGRIFAGTDPQNIIGELRPISSDPLPNINNVPVNNRIYSILKEKQANKQGFYVPIPSIVPPPTPEDYSRGYFRRYIVVRLNDKSYFETTKEVFEDFFIKNYNTTLNKVFRINWSLKEDNEEDNTKTLRYFETKLPGIFDFFPDKKQYSLKAGVVNISPTTRIYPDGVTIPKILPAAYQEGNKQINTIDNPRVPSNQYCGNCKFHQKGYCNRWNANIRHNYWCAVWQGLGSQE